MTWQPGQDVRWGVPLPRRPAAFALQERMARWVREEPLPRFPALVGGLDVAYYEGKARAAVVVISVHKNEIVAAETYETTDVAPYVPGLLAWRELSPLLGVLERLAFLPDVLLCDGHGRAHPRRLGLASHLGLLLDHPTIGCAKSRLVGTYDALPGERGASVPLVDKGEEVGRVVRTRAGVRPVYVSVGHRITLAEAVDVVLRLAHYRLPEPIRLADALARQGHLPHYP